MAYRGLHALSQPAYLEDFIHAVSNLPHELREKYGRVGELDATVQRLKSEADALVRELLRRPSGTEADRRRELSVLQRVWPRLEQLQAQCVKLSQEKIALAESAYNSVDQHVRDLDAKLREYEAYLRREGQWPDGAHGLVPSTDGSGTSPVKASSGAGTPRSGNKLLSRTSRKNSEPTTLNIMDDMPIDPNEPRYCYCQNVSYGQMVACESGNCPYEWFHFECVGLTEPPKDEWICPDCRARTNRGR
jgi:inhibitor of growth protein 4